MLSLERLDKSLPERPRKTARVGVGHLAHEYEVERADQCLKGPLAEHGESWLMKWETSAPCPE